MNNVCTMCNIGSTLTNSRIFVKQAPDAVATLVGLLLFRLLLRLFGCDVHVAGPRTLVPKHFAEAFDVTVHDRVEPALEGADVVMALRIQRERLSEALLPSLREYSRLFGLDRERLGLAEEDAIVMHPGPMNRGVEIQPDVADGPQSVILDQVEAGVATRMAVLYLLLGQGEG